MIAFNDITLAVAGKTLLENASLHVAGGQKVVVRGASGCGKSSLLMSAAGALPLAAGTICVEGQALGRCTVAAIRARIAYIGQEPVMGADTVRDALLLPFSFKAHRGNRPDEERIAGILERLHLPDRILGQSTKRISGGEKQRIAVARALLLGKTIFLADEVSAALDPQSRAAVMQELFAPGITLLSVSHDPAWIDACDRRIDILDQRLVEAP